MPINELGIAATTFNRRTLAANLETIARYGLTVVHYDVARAGLTSLPDEVPPELAYRIAAAASERGIHIAAVAGAFNPIHPVVERRRDGLRRLRQLAAACSALGTSTITLSSGTRDADDLASGHAGLASGHADNATPAAWADLLETLEAALDIADEFNVELALEPNAANVVDSPAAAKRLLDELRSPRLKLVLDPANLAQLTDLPRQQAVLDEAIDVLGPYITVAYATDFLVGGGQIRRVAAGTGHLDYAHYLRRLSILPVPLIVCGLSEFQVPAALWFLRTTTQAARRLTADLAIGA
jgi:sugar phosphate isomerase/epimerase